MPVASITKYRFSHTPTINGVVLCCLLYHRHTLEQLVIIIRAVRVFRVDLFMIGIQFVHIYPVITDQTIYGDGFKKSFTLYTLVLTTSFATCPGSV